ncbi:formate dehydrogenase accessory sulfurtransferase FdhD [Aeromicrobium sp.]|uniref:formate dehydrogenase accessory sulfurtransferase FdhD n=1 Tax=Aeromicrobium sp. TaxID=1871063 RepID=UPI002FC78FC0
MIPASVTRTVTTVGLIGRQDRSDELASEAPLEIRVNARGYAVTMRTPGNDVELSAGFLVSEGLVAGPDDLLSVDVLAEVEGDVIDAKVAGPGALVAMDRQRNIYTTSSCGVCGLASIEAVRTTSRFELHDNTLTVAADLVAQLPGRLQSAQRLFESTGGVHAAGLFDVGDDSVVVREDVGRHNAVDKVVGHAALEGRLPLSNCVLQVSGRASFELVQKAAMAGVPILAAVSAPSALAVELAEALGITLIGFSRESSFNIYSHGHRVTGALS